VSPGARILVINGASRGLVGVVKAPSKFSFDGEPCWVVQLDELSHTSTIREGFLCPEPERSDEDVLGPLRNVRCP